MKLGRDADLPPAFRRHAAGTAAPCPNSGRAGHQLALCASSSSVGKRPAAFLEKRSTPSTVTSNTPPLDLRKFTSADGAFERMMSRAARARGS
jgi:hypothetical protein